MTQKHWDEMMKNAEMSKAIYKIGVVIGELSILHPKGEKKNRKYATWINFNVDILKDARKTLEAIQ